MTERPEYKSWKRLCNGSEHQPEPAILRFQRHAQVQLPMHHILLSNLLGFVNTRSNDLVHIFDDFFFVFGWVVSK